MNSLTKSYEQFTSQKKIDSLISAAVSSGSCHLCILVHEFSTSQNVLFR